MLQWNVIEKYSSFASCFLISRPRMADHPIFTIMDQDIPEAQQSLRESHANLDKVAHYCRANYLQAEDKRQALEETKNYATQALASVAYQINAFSYHLMQLFDHQEVQMAEMESQVRHVNETVMIHKEKIARREIGALATTNKPMQRQHKILPPPAPERAIRYTRRPIDYNVYDDLGHGQKSAQPINPRTNVRKGSSTVTDSSSISSGPSSTYDTGAIYRKTGTLNPSLNLTVSGTGTLSRNQGRNASDYRTPVPVPPPPPVVPPGAAAANMGHYGPAGMKAHVNAAAVSSPHLSARGDYHQSNNAAHGGNYGTAPSNPASGYGSASQNHSPVPNSAMHSHYASQKQVFQYPTTASPRKLSSGSTGNGYGPLPVTNGVPNGSYPPQMRQQNNLTQSSNIPLPPPLPPVDVYNGSSRNSGYTASVANGSGRGSVRSTSSGLPSRTSITSEMINSPPLPPPPPEPTLGLMMKNMHIGNGVSETIPSHFLEKVVALYDYAADKDDELSFMENQIIYVIKKNDDGWYEGVMEGMRGLFPGNYVEPCP